MISGASGFTFGLKRRILPFGVMRNFSKFHITGPAKPLESLTFVRCLYSSWRFLPLTSDFSVIGKVMPQVVEQYSLIASSLFSSCLKLPDGTPRTVNPRSLYFF